jgi:hypothetical protein
MKVVLTNSRKPCFLRRSLNAAVLAESIGEKALIRIQNNVEHYVSVSNLAERSGEDGVLGNDRLALTIECSVSGWQDRSVDRGALKRKLPSVIRSGTYAGTRLRFGAPFSRDKCMIQHRMSSKGPPIKAWAGDPPSPVRSWG